MSLWVQVWLFTGTQPNNESSSTVITDTSNGTAKRALQNTSVDLIEGVNSTYGVAEDVSSVNFAPVGEEGVAVCKRELHPEAALDVIKVLDIDLQHKYQLRLAN
jgi:hypothetical protein